MYQIWVSYATEPCGKYMLSEMVSQSPSNYLLMSGVLGEGSILKSDIQDGEMPSISKEGYTGVNL